MRYLLDHLWHELNSVEIEIEELGRQIHAIAQKDAACQRLRTVRGVVPLVPAALIAAVGNGSPRSCGPPAGHISAMGRRGQLAPEHFDCHVDTLRSSRRTPYSTDDKEKCSSHTGLTVMYFIQCLDALLN